MTYTLHCREQCKWIRRIGTIFSWSNFSVHAVLILLLRDILLLIIIISIRDGIKSQNLRLLSRGNIRSIDWVVVVGPSQGRRTTENSSRRKRYKNKTSALVGNFWIIHFKIFIYVFLFSSPFLISYTDRRPRRHSPDWFS